MPITLQRHNPPTYSHIALGPLVLECKACSDADVVGEARIF